MTFLTNDVNNSLPEVSILALAAWAASPATLGAL